MEIISFTSDYIHNNRIRTVFLNNKSERCFVEFGSCRDYGDMLMTEGIINYEKENEKYIKLSCCLPHPFTKQRILKTVNKIFDCSYNTVRVCNYFVNTDDFTCRSKAE